MDCVRLQVCLPHRAGRITGQFAAAWAVGFEPTATGTTGHTKLHSRRLETSQIRPLTKWIRRWLLQFVPDPLQHAVDYTDPLWARATSYQRSAVLASTAGMRCRGYERFPQRTSRQVPFNASTAGLRRTSGHQHRSGWQQASVFRECWQLWHSFRSLTSNCKSDK